MKYRTIRKGDIEKIQELAMRAWKNCYKEIYCESRIKKEVETHYETGQLERDVESARIGNECFIVAEDKDRIFGYAQVKKQERTWELMRIYVEPTMIGKGTGTILIERVDKWLRKKGAKKYIAHPHTKNTPAKRFYRKMGFTRKPTGDRGWNSPCFEKLLT